MTNPPGPRWSWPGWADRARDRRVRRPPELLHDAAGRPGPGTLLGLALQILAVQAVYLLVPVVLAQAMGLDGRQTANLLALTLLAMAAAGLLHALPRGPVGAGYAITTVPTPVALGAHLAAAGLGVGMAQAGPAILGAALLVLAVLLAFPRLPRLIPVEIAGVVSMALGLSLLPSVVRLGLPAAPAAEEALLPLVLGVIVVASLLRWALAPFALLLGGVAGVAAGLLLWPPGPEAAALTAGLPWLALPRPAWPDLGGAAWDLLPAFAVVALCLLPSTVGSALLLQKEGDADWVKPDPAPVQRAMVATTLGMGVTGLLGGMVVNVSSGGVGLVVATRILARAVVWANAALLLALACSPLLLAQLLLLPGAVAAAMLLYLACFMVAAGAQQVASRVLDKRRTVAVGLGLLAATLAMLAPGPLRAILPDALVAPVTLGFVVALGVHLLTLPLVRRSERLDLKLDAAANRALEGFVERAGGAFGLRRATTDALAHAAIEVAEVLAARGVPSLSAEMTEADGRVRLALRHPGPPLPPPARVPRAEDLAAAVAAQEAFAMWLAARQADRCAVRAEGAQAVVEMEFSE
ncbi:solute carrier family 23 protein [Roseococcus sp. DSY-14]|uniref:solute carrier family 23 protein n=1 Tax=Roseococcus sp. DSY-14 TaxID=3369650 RepID=UPI00387B10F6